jgi:mRNA interferase RelE/StbE
LVWQIRFSEESERNLRDIGHVEAKRVVKSLKKLADSGQPKQLADQMKYEALGFWKYRIGKYRAIFSINDTDQLLSIVMIEHRQSVYKTLKHK